MGENAVLLRFKNFRQSGGEEGGKRKRRRARGEGRGEEKGEEAVIAAASKPIYNVSIPVGS